MKSLPLNLQTIIDNAQAITIDKKGNTVNAMSLETLIVSKFRANRDQDNEDDEEIDLLVSEWKR